MGPIDGSDACVISQVVEESGAAQAGIAVGDRVLAIDGREVASFQDLITIVACRDPGTEIELEVDREGEKFKTKATLQPRPPTFQ